MIKKILFIFSACILIQHDTHAAGFFNKAARGLYQTTKWGLIAVPLAVPVISKLGLDYIKKNHPEVFEKGKRLNETLDNVEKYSLESLKTQFLPEHQENADMINTYIKQLASGVLKVPEDMIVIKVDPHNPSTSHSTIAKDGKIYHSIHLGLGCPILNIWDNLVDHVKYNKPTSAPFFIKHEIAHGKFEHGKKKGYFALGCAIAGYVAMTSLLLKKRSLISIAQQSSTPSVLLKTALAVSFPFSLYKLHEYTGHTLSRKFEWEADNFAISQITDPEILEAAALAFDKQHVEIQKTGINDLEHPEAKDRAQNLRIAAEKLRKEQVAK